MEAQQILREEICETLIWKNELKIISAYDQKISKDILDYYDRLWTNRDGDFTLPYDEHKNEKLMNDLLFRFMEINGFGIF